MEVFFQPKVLQSLTNAAVTASTQGRNEVQRTYANSSSTFHKESVLASAKHIKCTSQSLSAGHAEWMLI